MRITHLFHQPPPRELYRPALKLSLVPRGERILGRSRNAGKFFLRFFAASFVAAAMKVTAGHLCNDYGALTDCPAGAGQG